MKKHAAIAISCMILAGCLADSHPAKLPMTSEPEPIVNCKEWSYIPAGIGVWVAQGATFILGKCTAKFAATSIGKHTAKVCGGYDLTDVLDAKCGAKAKQ